MGLVCPELGHQHHGRFQNISITIFIIKVTQLWVRLIILQNDLGLLQRTLAKDSMGGSYFPVSVYRHLLTVSRAPPHKWCFVCIWGVGSSVWQLYFF